MQNRHNGVVASEQQVDVVVVGGGMVGCAAAAALGQLGYSVVIVEAGPEPRFPGHRHAQRVSAISPASVDFLDRLGAWQDIASHRVSPYERMFVWDASGSGSLEFDAADIGQPRLGYIIENAVINAALAIRARASLHVRMLTGTRVEDIQWFDDRTGIRLDSGDVLNCSLLVGADGGGSQVRRAAGLDTRGHAYRQTAIVANVQTEKPHRRTAWQRFLDTGPLAFLPLSDGSCSIVWSADDAVAGELLALSPQAFEERLQEAFEFRLGSVRLLGDRAGFPLIHANAVSYAAHRMVLTGDAAHRIHPLAGQGVNLGLGDVMVLQSILKQAHQAGREAGDALYLRRYARARRAQASMMMAGMDAIQRLFTDQTVIGRAARNIGLRLVDECMPLKSFFMHQAIAGPGDDSGQRPGLA